MAAIGDSARSRVRALQQKGRHPAPTQRSVSSASAERPVRPATAALRLLEAAVTDYERELVESVRTASLRPGQENALITLLRETRKARDEWTTALEVERKRVWREAKSRARELETQLEELREQNDVALRVLREGHARSTESGAAAWREAIAKEAAQLRGGEEKQRRALVEEMQQQEAANARTLERATEAAAQSEARQACCCLSAAAFSSLIGCVAQLIRPPWRFQAAWEEQRVRKAQARMKAASRAKIEQAMGLMEAKYRSAISKVDGKVKALKRTEHLSHGIAMKAQAEALAERQKVAKLEAQYGKLVQECSAFGGREGKGWARQGGPRRRERGIRNEAAPDPTVLTPQADAERHAASVHKARASGSQELSSLRGEIALVEASCASSHC